MGITRPEVPAATRPAPATAGDIGMRLGSVYCSKGESTLTLLKSLAATDHLRHRRLQDAPIVAVEYW